MATPTYRTLGMVQFQILRLIDRDPTNAYGVGIASALCVELKRNVPDGQVSLALKRLEDHDLIQISKQNLALSKKTPGRPRKYFALTSKGRGALENAGTYALESQPILKKLKEALLDGNIQKGKKIPDPVVG